MTEDFWEQYETFSNNIESAGHRFFANNLRRWFALLDGETAIAPIIRQLETSMDFQGWYKASENTLGSMVGSATLEFPIKTTQRLGAHLFILRRMATGDLEHYDFASHFLYTANDFDTMVRDINSEIFAPLHRELRTYLEREIRTANILEERGSQSAPASDRVVPLDHNSAEYSNAIESLNKLRDAVAETNDYEDQGDKEQQLAELSAGKALLDAHQARIWAIRAVLVRCLKYLGEKFLDNIVGTLATAAFLALVALFGIHIM